MTTTPVNDRYLRLVEWMREHDISLSVLGDEFGMTGPGIRGVLVGNTCPTRHHEALLRLGFPEELLPVAFDKPRGRQRKVPRFPGLSSAAM